MKKILALVLAMLLVLGMTSAFAATITINRDSSWKPTDKLQTGESNEATYTWHRIFDANLDDANHPVYTISGPDAAAKVAALDTSIFEAKQAADGKYYITLKDNIQDATVFAALATMVANYPDLFPGTAVTSHDNPVVIDVGNPGYFYIEASNGKNVAVQTTGTVEIKEKNDYPKIDKKQRKAAGEDFTDHTIEAEIGKLRYFEITVDVPEDVNKPIYVVDKMTDGLTFNADSLSATAAYTATPSTDANYDNGSDVTFQIMFSKEVVEANKGGQITITYNATVNADALIPGHRENEVTLKYDEGNYVLKDKVEETIYYTGIKKVDGTTEEPLAGVKFTLTADGAAYNVYKPNGKDYYIPGGSSNEVETDADGLIKIRGLDNKVVYILTETETLDGYNLLDAPKTLTLVEDTSEDIPTTVTFDRVVNNKGNVLPSTGGMGTTILYIAGSILVLGAVIFLVTKRRMKAED